MIYSVQFLYDANVIIVTLDDGTSQEYSKEQKDEYIRAFPDREGDVLAMGW